MTEIAAGRSIERPAHEAMEAPRPGSLVPKTIVPLWGLPIVGAVLIGLVVAIASDKLWAVDFFHVVGGALWTGIDLFVGLIIGPILGRLSIPARAEFSARFMPKMMLIMPTLVTVTLAAGWQLGLLRGFVNAGYPNHEWAVASYVVVAVMAVVALGVLEPANIAVLYEMRKPEPNGEIISKLMGRFVWASGVTGVMQIATLIIMTKLASV